MENGQKVKIPLNSNINIKSDDMLEDINKPTFIDNPQQYQGRYLPTSLRFEHNGWAAGDKVYNFKDESITVTDSTKRFTVTKTFITDNIIQLTVTDTLELISPFSFYWSISSVEKNSDISVVDSDGAVATVSIDTVYDDGADGIPMRLRITWDGKVPECTDVTSLDNNIYDVDFTYNNATLAWDMQIINRSYYEPEHDVTLMPDCNVQLNESCTIDRKSVV